jgi:hypothetical protein
MIEVSYFKTPLNVYQNARQYFSKKSHIHIRRYENFRFLLIPLNATLTDSLVPETERS